MKFGKDTPLSEALLQSSRKFEFKVAYDARLLSKAYSRDEASGSSVEELLDNLLMNSGFSYVYKHGSYLIITGPEATGTEATQVCQLQGSVTDAGNGEQLPFASVSVPDQNINVAASSNGTFSIKNIVANPVHLVVSYIGYHAADTVLFWTSSPVGIRISLKQKVTPIKSVDVIQNKVDIIDYRHDIDFATIINPAKLIELPIFVETDIFRTLQLLPGIRYSENSSELSIRGGTSDQNMVLFDGQTLYNLSHYYGVFSSVNPNIVKDIQVYKGGFDSRYGERISAIVDITGKSGNQVKPCITADMNLLSVNLAMEMPVTKKLTLVAAGRRSYSDIYKTSFADHLFKQNAGIQKDKPDDTVVISEPSFHFYDLNGKLSYRISDRENLSFSIYGGKDDYLNSYTVSSPALFVSNTDSSSWYNYGMSLNWQKQWNPSFFSSVLAGTSGYVNAAGSSTHINRLLSGGEEQQFLPDTQNVFIMQSRNELKDYSLALRNTFLLNSFNQLDFGILIRKNDLTYYKDADKVYVYDNTRQSASLSTVYVQDYISVGQNLVVKPGFRLTYYSGTGDAYLEPRMAIRYKASDHLSLRLATGKYNQFISQVLSPQETGYAKSFWALSNDSANPVLQSRHFILGATFEKRKFLLDVEGYYKKYSGLQEYIYLSQFLRNTDFDTYFPPDSNNTPGPAPVPVAPSYFITGSGKSYGIDFFACLKFTRYTTWFSYTLSKSIQHFNEINFGEAIPALTDQRHQVSFTHMVTLNKWNLGAVVLYATGRPYITFSENKMHAPIERRYGRSPDYFRCDISANYNFLIKSVRLKAGIAIINLFNHQNYHDVNTRTFNFDQTSFTETNLIQSQKLSLNVFLHVKI